MKPYSAPKLTPHLPQQAETSNPPHLYQAKNTANHTAVLSGEAGKWKPRLSNIERRIFRTLQDAAPGVVPAEQLVSYVNSAPGDSGINAVRVHINRLRKKLENDSHCPIQIVTLRGEGYSLQVRESSENNHALYTSACVRNSPTSTT